MKRINYVCIVARRRAGFSQSGQPGIRCQDSHLLQPVEQRRQKLRDGLRRQAALALQPGLQRLAAHQRHDHVGRAVGLEEGVDIDDAHRPFEPRQDPRLGQEPLAAPAEILGQLGGMRQHRQVGLPHREAGRQVLLDRHLAIELRVDGTIGDAEGALAQHRDDLELADTRAGRQRSQACGWRGRAGGLRPQRGLPVLDQDRLPPECIPRQISIFVTSGASMGAVVTGSVIAWLHPSPSQRLQRSAR